MKKLVVLFFIILLVSCAGMKKANQMYQKKNYQLAITECQKAIEQDSLNTEAYLIMGKSFRALDKIDQAIDAFRTASQIQPETRLTAEATKEMVDTKMIRADRALENENYNRAFSDYKDILAVDSTHFRANFQLAVAYEKNRWLDQAENYFSKAARLQPNDSTVTLKLEKIDSLKKEAQENFEKGKSYYDRERNQSAVKYLSIALESQADHDDAKYYFHMAQGKVLFKKGSKSRLWDAIEHFGKAMVMRLESAEPHYHLARAYEKKDRNEFDNAIREYKTAIEKEPDGPFAAPSRKKIKSLSALKKKLEDFWGK